MKKLLKILLMPVLAGSPAMTVVACGTTSSQISDQDILNQAYGRMQNFTFNMTDLGLKEIPANGDQYDHLDINAQNLIVKHFQDLITADSLNWPYATANMRFNNTTGVAFSYKYGDSGRVLEASISLGIVVTYKTLVSNSKPVVIKIANDSALSQAKATALGNYLTNSYFNNNPIINIKNMPLNGITADRATNTIIGLKSDINAAILKPVKNTPAIIDIPGVTLQLTAKDSTSSDIIFGTPSYDANSKAFTGNLTNLKITVNYQGAKVDVTPANIKVAQTLDDAKTQISVLLGQGSGTTSSGTGLPAAGENFKDFSDRDTQFSSQIKTKFYNIILAHYPEKVGSWDITKLIFNDQSNSSIFTVQTTDPSGTILSGYFDNIILTFSPTGTPNFSVDSSSLRIIIKA